MRIFSVIGGARIIITESIFRNGIWVVAIMVECGEYGEDYGDIVYGVVWRCILEYQSGPPEHGKALQPALHCISLLVKPSLPQSLQTHLPVKCQPVTHTVQLPIPRSNASTDSLFTSVLGKDTLVLRYILSGCEVRSALRQFPYFESATIILR